MDLPYSFHKTRLAPTPSGFLHAGNILSFCLTAFLAQATHARLLLRIDDLDRQRMQPAYLQDVFDSLNFLRIPWQEGPRDAPDFEARFSQRHRQERYRQALEELRGQVFACSCSRTNILRLSPDGRYPGTCRQRNLPLDRQGLAWRMRTGDDPIIVKGLDGVLTRSVLPAEMQDFVVRKKNGDPSYQLASLVDDLYFGVDLVVRGQDLWPSTLAQQLLARALGEESFRQAAFFHHPLVLDADGGKLSKSAGARSVQQLRQEGSRREEVFGRIAAAVGLDPLIDNWQLLGREAYRRFHGHG